MSKSAVQLNGANGIAAQSLDGKRGADPPKEKAPLQGRSSSQSSAKSDYSANGNGQALSSLGQNGRGSHYDEIATGSIIGAVRRPYDRLPSVIFDDDIALSPPALGVLCYLLQRPPNWVISVPQLERHFGGHGQMIRHALEELRRKGYSSRTVMLGTRTATSRGRPILGQMWFARRSIDDEWPTRVLTKGLECASLRYCGEAISASSHFRVDAEPRRLINTDTVTKLNNDIRAGAKARRKRKVSAAKSSSSFGVDGYQDQATPDVETVSAALRRNWGNKAVTSHPKFPEFGAWCYTQRNKKGGRGKPHEKGFWTWLAKQKKYWRDKVKEPDEQPGYVLDGKFYDAAAANELCASDPEKYTGCFRPAVKRDGKIELVREQLRHRNQVVETL